MTVIAGVNLCDRVYVAGDSRISDVTSVPGKPDEVRVKHDNMQKVEILPNSHNTLVASAGDARFARHILNRLAKADFTKNGASAIRTNIESWILPIAEKYFANGYASATFIFGGADPSSKQVIDGKRIGTLMTEYNFGKDGASGKLKQPLYEGIMAKGYGVPNPTPELSISKTILFSVRVSRHGVKIEDTEWGEYLIYGPEGLVREDVPQHFVGNLEYNQQAGNPEWDIPQIITLVHVTAHSKQLDSVGGSVMVMGGMHDKSSVCYPGDLTITNPATGDVMRNRLRLVGSTFYRLDDKGTYFKLTPVSDFTGGSKKLQLLI